MDNHNAPFKTPAIESVIYQIRGQKVILDSDLAILYAVETRVLNQAVKRNNERFPEGFMFQLTKAEAAHHRRSRSQFVTLKRGYNIKYLPYAFTEHGVLMAANVINSKRAVAMSIRIIEAFVKMRRWLGSSAALMRKLAELESRITGHDQAIKSIVDAIRELMNPPEPPRKQIGFHVKN